MKHSDFTTIAKVITPGIKQFVKAEVARAIAEQSQPPANNGALLDVLCEMFAISTASCSTALCLAA